MCVCFLGCFLGGWGGVVVSFVVVVARVCRTVKKLEKIWGKLRCLCPGLESLGKVVFLVPVLESLGIS